MTDQRWHEAVISLGSNIAEAERKLRDAIGRLKEVGRDIVVSEFYHTPDISGSGVMYLNAVLKGRFMMDAASLHDECKTMELSLGHRKPSSGAKGEVAIDIDVVTFDGEVLRPVDYGRRYFTIGMEYLQGGRVL